MVGTIKDDLNHAFRYGNMVTKLIIINVAIFIITALCEAFMPTFYNLNVLPYLALSGDFHSYIYKPWTIITHFFMHNGFLHILWNMLILYWFGYITGDLLGDKKILPLFITGGIFGGVVFLLIYSIMYSFTTYAVGASAAVLSIVFAAVITAPDYKINLLLIGSVSIKYIGLVILFLDIIGTSGNSNAGGHIAHLAGSSFGILYVILLRRGVDIFEFYNSIWDRVSFKKRKSTHKFKNKLKIAHKALDNTKKHFDSTKDNLVIQKEVDRILDKKNVSGIESLTEEEQDTLYKASKD